MPTVLVKILGVFKITNKSTQSTHTYVLMEDLFYNHKISKVLHCQGLAGKAWMLVAREVGCKGMRLYQMAVSNVCAKWL